MKNFLFLLLMFMLVTGCSWGKDMTNTPTKKVEGYLDKYKTLDADVLKDLDVLISKTDYTMDQKSRYREVMKKHYEDLTYTIKDETINGDTAKVEVEIEVKDYSKILTTDNSLEEFYDENGQYDSKKYYDYQLDLLEKAKDKVKYTITFDLTKTDDEWTIDELSNTNKEKLHGIYVY